MKAGRELDALVAEKVMGFELRQPKGERYIPGVWIYAINDFGPDGPIYVLDCPSYSTDIAAAFNVLCKLGERGLGHTISGHPDTGFWCEFSNGEGYEASAEADDSPLAICLAAIKAVS